MDGYTESGAAGGNIIFPDLHTSGVSGFFGGEASVAFDDVHAILRLTCNTEDVYQTGSTKLSLASAADVMGTQSVALPGLARAHVAPSLSLTGGNLVQWSIGYGARLGVDDGTEHHVMLGARINF